MKFNILHVAQTVFAEIFDALKGPRTMYVDEKPTVYQKALLVKMIDNNYIGLYFKEIQYMVQYKRWWVANDYTCIYHFYCIASDDSPEELKRIVEKEMYIPCFTSKNMRIDKAHLKAIETYVDVLFQKAGDKIKPNDSKSMKLTPT